MSQDYFNMTFEGDSVTVIWHESSGWFREVMQ